jgi:hypothetical protein
MTEEEKRKARIRAIKNQYMTGDGKVDKIDTRMKNTDIDEFVRRQKERRMIKDIEGDAIRERLDMKRRALRKQALKGVGSLKGIPGKLAGKIPALGAIAGPLAALAMGAKPDDALASGLGSDDVGAGSDEVGDMGLSRADRLMAERKALEGASERRLADLPEGLADMRKKERDTIKFPDMNIPYDPAGHGTPEAEKHNLERSRIVKDLNEASGTTIADYMDEMKRKGMEFKDGGMKEDFTEFLKELLRRKKGDK